MCYTQWVMMRLVCLLNNMPFKQVNILPLLRRKILFVTENNWIILVFHSIGTGKFVPVSQIIISGHNGFSSRFLMLGIVRTKIRQSLSKLWCSILNLKEMPMLKQNMLKLKSLLQKNGMQNQP